MPLTLFPVGPWQAPQEAAFACPFSAEPSARACAPSNDTASTPNSSDPTTDAHFIIRLPLVFLPRSPVQRSRAIAAPARAQKGRNCTLAAAALAGRYRSCNV